MFITEYIGRPMGHAGLDFVDITTSHDTRLFLDPCLIERCSDSLSRDAAALFSDFADQMYLDMRNGRWNSTHVFDEAHEIHETKLGYGNGRNGKGKTSHGMCDSLNGLCQLANNIRSISKIQDVSVLVEGFAEDCMSDLLTNILRLQLSSFTEEQMRRYGKTPQGFHEIKSWDSNTHDWTNTQVPYWQVDDNKILLVPKRWVRKRHLFRAHQYLYAVILERIRNEFGNKNLTKKDMWRNIRRDTKNWEYDKVIDFTLEHPDALGEYHNRMYKYYDRANGCMSDDDLDEAVYGQYMSETA